MASSSSSSFSLLPPYSSTLIKPSRNLIIIARRAFQVRARGCGDEEMWSSEIVEANLSVLRERILQVKMKEKLERCCRCKNGWNYESGYDYKLRKQDNFSQFFHLLGLVFGTFGFTCLTGTFFLCLVSFIIQLNH